VLELNHKSIILTIGDEVVVAGNSEGKAWFARFREQLF